MRLQELLLTTGISVQPQRRLHQALLVASLFLSLIGFGYLIHGTYAMFTRSGDYKMRWVEERYVFRGKNPADIFARIQAQARHRPILDNGRDSWIDPDLGPADGIHPLSSYFTAALLTWPPTFASGRAYNGVLSLLFLAGVMLWAYLLGLAQLQSWTPLQWLVWIASLAVLLYLQPMESRIFYRRDQTSPTRNESALEAG
jgi:hypothetical protein